LIDPRLGTILQGRYWIRSQLATGAMGTVYRGERVSVGRPVAIKFLNPAVAAHDVYVEQFRNEVRALSRVCHPNCATMIDFGVERTPYVVMDLFGGVTLRQALNEDYGRIAPPRALHLARQLLAGLAHVHAQRIVHSDVKPENVLVSNEPGFDDHLRIVDFGLAQLHDVPVLPAEVAIGTPTYMAPVQWRREGGADQRSDLYAVGVVLFELLTGVKPFPSPEVGDILRMKLDSPVPRIREAAPKVGLSEALEAVVARAMATAAADRHPSAAAFEAALDATPEGAARRERPPVIGRRPQSLPPSRTAAGRRKHEPPPWAAPPPLPVDAGRARFR
jgi:serine/threonine protein kinase